MQPHIPSSWSESNLLPNLKKSRINFESRQSTRSSALSRIKDSSFVKSFTEYLDNPNESSESFYARNKPEEVQIAQTQYKKALNTRRSMWDSEIVSLAPLPPIIKNIQKEVKRSKSNADINKRHRISDL
ncbi:Hypothetical_protein [Hexamita inflata]|uniref:Hypothetical_protein n=1 Tax=Hexamita inflata TaxID=28002 RepID=A0AA86QQW0_9EUKA|nr:Hypothetical protein HINF_LOCUS43960 [Hexamita inflata]